MRGEEGEKKSGGKRRHGKRKNKIMNWRRMREKQWRRGALGEKRYDGVPVYLISDVNESVGKGVSHITSASPI